MINSNYENIYSNVMKELILITTHQFKNLLTFIRDSCKNKNEFVYEFNSYKFNENFTVIPTIRFHNYHENAYYVYISCVVYDDFIYKNADDSSFATILDYHVNITCEKDPTEPYVFKIAKALDLIKDLNKDYVYSKYHDSLIVAKKYKKMMLIDIEEATLCKREIDECIVCYEPVAEELITRCCEKHICRVCVEQLIPKKCPNCRCDYDD